MVKHELLVPAGDMESLNQAVANGADAVYIGCKSFNARSQATNFSNEEIQMAIKLCHLYGVKLYVTMNILVKDNEVGNFLAQIEFLHKSGVDAVIMQDFGMICLVREKYPNLEIHASTQANTSSKDTADIFYKLGVKRVVLAREMTLTEIKDIKVPIEKEVFVHGALCVAYSGCCLMSSMLQNRSGNRGECAGFCRLPYTLKRYDDIIEQDKYLLSTKELNTSTRFRELLDSDIASFKIEGRMKSPEYVGFVTRFYRKIIDSYCTNIDFPSETSKLKTLYNRGFTLGHLFNKDISELLNINYPNHSGLEIGRVVALNDKKIKIELNHELNQQDGIRFLKSQKGFIVNYLYDESGKLTNSATDICYVDNKVELKNLDIVCKTKDYKLETELKHLPPRKVPISFKVTAKKDEPLIIEISDGKNNLKVEGNNVEQSLNAPIDDIKIRVQLEKLGDTPFISKSTIITSDPNIFIPIKELNELRRQLTNDLTQIRMNYKKEVIINNVSLNTINIKKETYLTALVYNEKQLEICNKLSLERIYVTTEQLYNKYRLQKNIYYKLPRCKNNPIDSLKGTNLVSDYFDFSLRDDLIGDYGLNVTNIFTAYYLYKLGLKTITLSVEMTEEEIIEFIRNYTTTFKMEPNIEILGYGYIENMLIKGNILNIKENDFNYKLEDHKKRFFKVYYDGINTHILNYEKKNLQIKEELKKYASIRLEFFEEDENTIKEIVKSYQ